MKTRLGYILSGAMFLFIMGCAGPQGEKAKVSEAKEVKTADKGKVMLVNTANSQVGWLGYKPTGQHFGYVQIAYGELMLDEGELVGGNFQIDMTAITNEDMEKEESKQKIVRHLKSDDFFHVEEYPVAEFVISDVIAWQGGQVEEGETGNLLTPTHEITGNLTIKGISKSISFPALLKLEGDDFMAYTPQFVINRTDWDIKYKSRKFFDDLKDNFIFDEIGLKIVLRASVKS